MKNSYRIFDLHIFTRREGGSKNEGTRSLHIAQLGKQSPVFFRESCTNDLHDCIKFPSIYLNTNCAEYLLILFITEHQFNLQKVL